ncbi:MAG: Rieske (2Fe-2S) protein [Acidimicrobiia bacterium]|nr:Rieske (2Fe-2S) protein [Acidimicrobiia bacterium]
MRANGEGVVAAAFLVSTAAALGLAVVYVSGGQTQLEGALLAVALGGIGVGLVSFAKRFMPTAEETEAREPLASTEEEVAAFTRDFEEGEQVLQRRGLLVKLGLGALGALGLAALFPIRSLGPRPGRGLKVTGFANSPRRVVTEDGRPVRADAIELGSLNTVWPEGQEQDADSPTLLLRVPEDELRLRPEREDWTIGGIVAFSKLCTHTGCPVGLYQQEEKLLLCPCHQSTFDVLEGARPVFGPAIRPLPQLPLAVDDEGFIVATGDFEEPVGGGFWDRGR